MKSIIKSGIVFLLFFLQLSVLQAQDNAKSQAYVVHEDPVNPSMVSQYEEAATNLVSVCKKYNLQDSWLALMMDNFSYIYVSPIKNFAGLDKNTFAPLQEKMGKEAFEKMFADFDKCYDSHRDFVVILDKELSYMPSGININQPGMPYRHYTYYYVKPQDMAKGKEIAQSFHDLHTKKNSKMEYRVYRSGFGERENYFLVVTSAKSAEDYEKMLAENNQLLGEEGKQLFNELPKYISGVKNITAMVRDDLSYSPGK